MFDELKTEYQKEFAYLKSVLPDVKEDILILQIYNAYTAIRNYLKLGSNVDMINNLEYFNAAVELATVYYNNYSVTLCKTQGNRAITQKSQGSRSVTYASADVELDSSGLTASVKAMLPNPPVWAF